MLEGKCLKCGYHCFGWALQYPSHQMFPKCGMELEIREEDRVFMGYSPFTAEEYRIKLPNEMLSNPESEESSREKKQQDISEHS